MIQIEINEGQTNIRCNGELVGLVSAFIISGDKDHALMPVGIDVNGAPVITEMTKKAAELLMKEGVVVTYLTPNVTFTIKCKERPIEKMIEL
jgi:hypothetical protein